MFVNVAMWVRAGSFSLEQINMARRGWLVGGSGILVAAMWIGVAVAADEPPVIPEGTHKQVTVLKPTAGNAALKLTAFCLDREGNVVTLVNHVVPPKAGQGNGRMRLQLRTLPRALDKKPAAEKPATEKPAAEKPAAEKSAEFKKAPGRMPVIRAIPALAQAPVTVEVAQAEATVAVEVDDAKVGTAEVRVLNPAGEIVAQWPVDFEGQAINVDADGNIIVAGDGFIARYDAKGKVLAKGEAPQVAKMAKSPEEMEKQARETLLGRAVPMEEALKTLEKQKVELDAKKDEDLTDAERLRKKSMDTRIASYQRSIENYKSPSDALVKSTAKQLDGRIRKVNAVAASGKHLFVTCGDPKGFGYSVWRTDADFSNPKQIVSGLSGCCGQMDVQCCGDELVVAENSRKRVVRYSPEGKKVASFGKASRDGAGDTFGSCCNPMNTRLHDGKLLVSDSDGRVRLFSLEGKYEGEVGKADVRPGCKSSTVAMSADGNRLYYIDVNTSQICVLDRKSGENTQASVR